MKATWQFKPLSDVCDIINGSTPLRSNREYWENGNINWFTIQDIREQGRKITRTNQKITHYALEKTSVRILPSKSVLLCCTASIGEYAITETPMATNQQFNGLVVKNQLFLEPLFLFHFCATLKDKLSELSGKTTIDFIPISRLRDINIPIPQLAEQHRIVSILDEAFEGIATVTANAKKNLANARELFESYKVELFDNNGEGYEQIELKELCEKITQGPNPKYDDKGVDEYRVLKTKNLYDNHIFYEEADKVSESVFNTCLSSELKNGDLLLAIVGQGSINKSNVFENKTPFRYIYTRALGLIRTNKLKLSPYYLLAFLQSKKGKALIDDGIGGTSGQQVVTTTHIKALKIPLPSIKNQLIIVEKLSTLSAETKKLEAIYQQKLVALEELKKSILNQAFSGAL